MITKKRLKEIHYLLWREIKDLAEKNSDHCRHVMIYKSQAVATLQARKLLTADEARMLSTHGYCAACIFSRTYNYCPVPWSGEGIHKCYGQCKYKQSPYLKLTQLTGDRKKFVKFCDELLNLKWIALSRKEVNNVN